MAESLWLRFAFESGDERTVYVAARNSHSKKCKDIPPLAGAARSFTR
jgi:hypothetical protein